RRGGRVRLVDQPSDRQLLRACDVLDGESCPRRDVRGEGQRGVGWHALLLPAPVPASRMEREADQDELLVAAGWTRADDDPGSVSRGTVSTLGGRDARVLVRQDERIRDRSRVRDLDVAPRDRRNGVPLRRRTASRLVHPVEGSRARARTGSRGRRMDGLRQGLGRPRGRDPTGTEIGWSDMTMSKNAGRSRDAKRQPGRTTWWAGVLVLLSGCFVLGQPPMQPLTARTLEDAQHRWEAHRADSYHLVVRVRAPRFDVAVYDVVVAGGELAKVERNGQDVRREDVRHYDYSVPGLFALLREDLRLADVPAVGDVPPLDLRAHFEPETGRLMQYRRNVGSARRRGLLVGGLEYQPPATDAVLRAAGQRASGASPPLGRSRRIAARGRQ